jgi:hypothetical protein
VKGNNGLKVAGASGAAALALFVGLGVGACGSGTTGQETPSRPPAATHQAPTHQAASPQDQAITWWLTTGKPKSHAVNHDLNAAGKDLTRMDLAALKVDGHQLVSDAETASSNPPPGALADPWSKAMAHYKAAGQALYDGQIISATNKINAAAPHLEEFMHALSGIMTN